MFARLALEAGRELHARYPAGRLLGGRPVKVADGTTASMPDTPANQHAYPQPTSQRPGLGFPLVRLVAVMSLSCAAVVGLAVGPYAGKGAGEPALLATLFDGGTLAAGDVLLADRYYASFCMMASLLAHGVDGLFRQHQHRRVDFRTGRRLGARGPPRHAREAARAAGVAGRGGVRGAAGRADGPRAAGTRGAVRLPRAGRGAGDDAARRATV